jgi:SAM-dependent methyltransferase
MSTVANTYDDLWTSSWGEMQTVGPVHRHVQEDLSRVIDKLDVVSILDVGCGGGDNLATLGRSAKGYELTGVDVSIEALRRASARVPQAQLELLDVQEQVLERTFDLVMSVQVVEHLLDDVAAFRHMAEMSDRYVLVSTVAGRMRSSERAIGHVRNYSEVELRTKLEVAGLDVLWIRGWGFPFYSPIIRSVSEWLPGGPPVGEMSRSQRRAASMLHHLYRLNVHGRGDVITALARR